MTAHYGLVPDAVEDYAEAHTTIPAEHLRALAAQTEAELSSPRMLTGAIEGRMLELLVFIAQPRMVLEIGTYSGYGTLAMAATLPPESRLITCEINPDHADFARGHIFAAGFGDRVEVRCGPALDTE